MMSVIELSKLAGYTKRSLELSKAALESMRLAIYPPICQICFNPSSSLQAVCEACAHSINWIERPCARCGAPLHTTQAVTTKKVGCIHCRRGSWPAHQVYCLAVYQGVIKDAIIAMKQPHSEPLGLYFGRRLAEQATRHANFSQADCVISVPHHWWKRLTHRHNSSDILALAVAQHLHLPLSIKALDRIKLGTKQGTLHRAQRERNIANAFRCHRGSERLKGKHVIVVDDIITSGATAKAICKPLKAAGVRKITFLAVGRGLNAGTSHLKNRESSVEPASDNNERPA